MKKGLYLLYLLVVVIVMIPKEELYYWVESRLGEADVYISTETVREGIFSLDVQNGDIILEDQKVATLGELRFAPWVVYNTLTLHNISPSLFYAPFFPGKIDEIVLSYTILHPLSIDISGKGDFGECQGSVDLIDSKVRIVFEPLPQLRQYPLITMKLHQEKEGLVYESDY